MRSDFQKVPHGGSQARNAVAVQGSGLQCRGHLGRMGPQIGLHTAAAGEERADFEPLPDIHASGALGTQKPLVPGEAEDVDAHFLHIDVENSGSLGGIDDVDELMPSGDGTDFCDIQQISREIGAMGGDDGLCIGTNFLFKILVADISQGIRRQNRQLHALILQLVEGTEHGVVLQCRGDHMVAGVQNALDGGVQGLGRIGGKGDALRAFRAEKLGQCRPGIVNDPRRAQRTAVDAPAGIAEGLHGLNHRLNDAVGLAQCGGGVVEIDHSPTSDQAVVNALGGDATFHHQLQKGILALIFRAPGQTAVGGDAARHGD